MQVIKVSAAHTGSGAQRPCPGAGGNCIGCRFFSCELLKPPQQQRLSSPPCTACMLHLLWSQARLQGCPPPARQRAIVENFVAALQAVLCQPPVTGRREPGSDVRDLTWVPTGVQDWAWGRGLTVVKAVRGASCTLSEPLAVLARSPFNPYTVLRSAQPGWMGT